MSAAAENRSTSSEARPRGTTEGANAPFFSIPDPNEPESEPLRAVRPADALRRRCRGARSALSRAAARGASGPLCRRARPRAARIHAAGNAGERGLSDLELAFAAGRLYSAITRRGSGVRDQYGDAT